MLKAKIISLFLVGFFFFGASQTFGAEDQSKLIEGAKKEGRVVYWSSGLTPELIKAIDEGFKKKYGLHDFQVVFSAARTTEQIAKVTQELRANRLTVDIISGAMPEFFYDLLKVGEVMKYDSPEYKYFSKAKGLLSEPGYWAPTISMSFIPMWNPKYIKKDITKYADLLDPQFKGMIVSGDPMKSESYLTYYMGLRKVLDKDFMQKLAKQDIVWFTRSPDVTTKVVTGERPVSFMGNNRTAYVAAMEGAQIKVLFPKEGTVILSNPFVTLKKAPHPNAAKLLVDYVNSKEGQTLMVEKSGYFTAREDVPIPPKVAQFSPPFSKITIIPMDWKAITEKDIKEARKEFLEIFGK
jgi:iron(III) transport system substrate-binding protein